MWPINILAFQRKQNYQFYNGECLAILRTLPDQSVDGIITDPPYSSGGLHSGSRMASPAKKYVQSGQKLQHPDFFGDNRDQRSFLYWSALWLSECLRIAKPGAPICVFSDWRQLPTTTDAIQAGGWIWRGVVSWDKTEAVRPVLGRFRSQCEFVIWGSKGDMPISRNVPVLPGAYRVIVKPKEKHHIAGKPLELMDSLIKIVEPGGTILDPFMGSASTGVAALKAGYKFIGIEMSQQYLSIAKQRIQEVA